MRVLIAVDDDVAFEDVLGTLRWCVRVSRDDEVILLHGTRYPWMRQAAEIDDKCKVWVEAEDRNAETHLDEARERLAKWGISAETVNAEGHPGEEILRVARARQVDLIILGALGSQQRGFPVGPVTQKVKSMAETDVLVVRRGAPIGNDSLRAVLAVDGSPESLAGVRSFAEKIRAKGADVTLVHVLDLPPVSAWEVLERDRPVDVTRLGAPVHAQVDAALGEALEILRARGIEATAEVWKGKAADEILAAADRHRAHLVVVGSRGLSGLRGLLLGSVARRIVNQGITSVLVARTPHEHAEV